MKRFTILATIIALVGCSHYEDVTEGLIKPSKNQTEFYASMPECDTRTYVEDNKYLRWNAEDEISIVAGNSYNSNWQLRVHPLTLLQTTLSIPTMRISQLPSRVLFRSLCPLCRSITVPTQTRLAQVQTQ